ncbi:hypothetical protein ACFQ2M_33595 [Kitasatospora saccharophila]|uniref:hypothetical protein n=1 Tax=Kitasatospora saccharophila TaxID=407973 RepID=UPI00362B670D
MVGADHRLQRDALVGAAGRGLADPGEFGLAGQHAGAQHFDERPEAALDLAGDLAAELFGGSAW